MLWPPPSKAKSISNVGCSSPLLWNGPLTPTEIGPLDLRTLGVDVEFEGELAP